MEAARSFLDAEIAGDELKCPGFQDHLNASINCYSHAIRVSALSGPPQEYNTDVLHLLSA